MYTDYSADETAFLRYEPIGREEMRTFVPRKLWLSPSMLASHRAYLSKELYEIFLEFLY
jgi:hypothetical protein